MDALWDELEDRVEQIFTATEQLREVAGDGKSTRQVLESLFRNVHSLKATASANEIDHLARIAHQFENLLHALRTGKARLDEQVLSSFDHTADAMFETLRQPDATKTDLHAELFARLQSVSEGTTTGISLESSPLNVVTPETWQSLSEEEKHRLEQSLGEGATLFLVNTNFDLAIFDQRFQELKSKLTGVGELISTAPKVLDERPDKIDFRILCTSDLELTQLQNEVADVSDVVVSEVSPQLASNSTDTSTTPTLPARLSQESGPQVIRIDLDDLDHLISSTHQLFRNTHECIGQLASYSVQSNEMQSQLLALDASFLSLASDLVNLRMVSIDRVLRRAFRAGRSAAAAAGKEVDFKVVGHELKIDKSLSDAIADPLIHLVRNAVDHGIESRSERASAGKPQRGTISIEATSLQGQTRIRVTDDGKGISPELVQSAGRRLGVLTDDRQIDMDKSLRLIFRSGFTTAATVSETSGRGVGLDVVEHSIEAVGGAIRVDSEPGAGSVFEIRLPVTFSLLDVIRLEVRGFNYLIDAAQVVSSLAGGYVNSLSVADLLGLSASEGSSSCLLSCNGYQPPISLLSNEPLVTEQVLVRNLGSHGARWVGVSGAAELPDGDVALLLDLPALLARYKFGH